MPAQEGTPKAEEKNTPQDTQAVQELKFQKIMQKIVLPATFGDEGSVWPPLEGLSHRFRPSDNESGAQSGGASQSGPR